MIDATSAATSSVTIQWGPIITVIVSGLFISFLGFCGWVGRKLENLTVRVAVIETKQSASFENTVQVARKTGVPEKSIRKLEDA